MHSTYRRDLSDENYSMTFAQIPDGPGMGLTYLPALKLAYLAISRFLGCSAASDDPCMDLHLAV